MNIVYSFLLYIFMCIFQLKISILEILRKMENLFNLFNFQIYRVDSFCMLSQKNIK